ncbi:uncharacterized protein LOC101239463 isoform X1 [Hydra vulgaris]|uniref:uncharacterized protein LOC101239463 isoform X1 n=1 Tax=Hydra vulgaris TaxID=6087 RepID=UPI001F5F9A92|nr:cell wall protein DAN4 [Hydra vulgaris]
MAAIATRWCFFYYFLALRYASTLMFLVSTDDISRLLLFSHVNLSINKTITDSFESNSSSSLNNEIVITSNIGTTINNEITITSNIGTIMITPSNFDTVLTTPTTSLNFNTVLTTPTTSLNFDTVLTTPTTSLNFDTVLTTPTTSLTTPTTSLTSSTSLYAAFTSETIFSSPSTQIDFQPSKQFSYFTFSKSSIILSTFSSNLFLSNNTLSTNGFLTTGLILPLKTYTFAFSSDIYVDTPRASMESSVSIVSIPDYAVLIINLKMKILTNFTAGLSDKNSIEYETMKDLIIKELSKSQQSNSAFINATVIGFTMGSVLVQAQFCFDKRNLDPSVEIIKIVQVNLIRYFDQHYDQIGSYNLDIYSFELNQVTSPSPTSSSSSFPAWLIILIIALIINIPLVLVIILLTWNLKKKRRVGSINSTSSNEHRASGKHSTIELQNLQFASNVVENMYRNEKGLNGTQSNQLFYGELRDEAIDENQENNEFKIPTYCK